MTPTSSSSIPNLRRRLTLADLHSDCDYSIWDGWEFDGFPVMTMVRGNVLVENGEWTGPVRYRPVRRRALPFGARERPRKEATARRSVTSRRELNTIGGRRPASWRPSSLLHPWFGCWQFWRRTVDALAGIRHVFASTSIRSGRAANWQEFASPKGLRARRRA